MTMDEISSVGHANTFGRRRRSVTHAAARLGCAILVSAACPVVSGCGDGRPGRVPVTGTVVYRGQPLAGGDVVFFPVEGSPGNRARGKANNRGEFALTTFIEGDGAVPGDYKVMVFAYRPADPQRDAGRIAPRAGFPAVPEKYFNVQTTDLTAKVESKPTVVQLELKD